MSEIKLNPCPFCGAEKDLQILNTGDLVGWTCHYDCDKQQERKCREASQFLAAALSLTTMFTGGTYNDLK